MFGCHPPWFVQGMFYPILDWLIYEQQASRGSITLPDNTAYFELLLRWWRCRSNSFHIRK